MFIIVAFICSVFSLTTLGDILVISLLFIILMVYMIVKSGVRNEIALTAFAINDKGEIFKIQKMNNTDGLFVVGAATGSLVDNVLTENGINSNGIATSAGTAVGAVSQLMLLSRNMEFMLNPDKVASIFTTNNNFRGFNVIKFLKCHSIIEELKKYVILCDYYDCKNNKIVYNKTVKIYKVYNNYLDIINIINNLKYN